MKKNIQFKQGDSVRFVYVHSLTKRSTCLNGVIISSFCDNEIYYNPSGKVPSVNYIFLNFSKYSLYNYQEDTYITKEKDIFSKKINLIEKIHPFFKFIFKTKKTPSNNKILLDGVVDC
jgi:hypothetical protein